MPNYYTAANRHIIDSSHLYLHGRIDNADHLCGIAAECALKHILIINGAHVSPDGTINNPYREHINKLWDNAVLYLHNRSGARSFPFLSLASTPFQHWTINNRYEDDGHAQDTDYQDRYQLARTLVGSMP